MKGTMFLQNIINIIITGEKMVVDLEILENNVISSCWDATLWLFLVRNCCFSRNNCWVFLSVLPEERKLSLICALNLHKVTCFVKNFSWSSAEGEPYSSESPFGHPSSLGKRFKGLSKKLPTQRSCLHLWKEHQLPRTHEFPAWGALSPLPEPKQSHPRLSIVKAEHTAPVSALRFKEIATE